MRRALQMLDAKSIVKYVTNKGAAVGAFTPENFLLDTYKVVDHDRTFYA